MSEKRPAETSTEEPVSKKQAITTEMYEEKISKLKKSNSEICKLKNKIAELEKRDCEAQEMTQKHIETFQERTAEAEEKMEMYKNITTESNGFLNSSINKDYLNYLNFNSKNTLSTIHHTFVFHISKYFIPGKHVNEGVWLYNRQRIISRNIIENSKCCICKNNNAKYGYKDDNIKFPFKINATQINKVLVSSNDGREEIIFDSKYNTLCKDCIIDLKLENTTYVED